MGEAASVFAEQLAKYKYGHALWWPEPTNGPHGREHEVEIGDVGYIDEDGAFQLLFNATYDANHELNVGSVPDGFVSLKYNKTSVETKEKFCRTGPLYSSSVRSHQVQGQFSADMPVPNAGSALSYRFQCSNQRGAFLMLWDDATKSVLRRQGRKFERYMRQHHWSWVEHATDPDQLGIRCEPEDIILVRGAVKTSSWTVAAFVGEGSHAHEIALEGQLGPVISVGLQYSSREACESLPVPPRSGPSHRVLSHVDSPTISPRIPPSSSVTLGSADQELPPKDQCVFLNYYKMRYRRFLPSKLEAAAKAGDGDRTGGPNTDEGHDLALTASESDASAELELRPPIPRSPLDDILDYIMEFSDAEVGITSHEDLDQFNLDGDWPTTFAHRLREDSPEVAVDESGVGFLALGETPSMPSTPNLVEDRIPIEIVDNEPPSAWQDIDDSILFGSPPRYSSPDPATPPRRRGLRLEFKFIGLGRKRRGPTTLLTKQDLMQKQDAVVGQPKSPSQGEEKGGGWLRRHIVSPLARLRHISEKEIKKNRPH